MTDQQLELSSREKYLQSCGVVQSVTGPVQVRWDQENASTPMGQLAYFIEFLNLTGLWAKWVESCPLYYTSPNASRKEEVLGTLLLSILSGHRRYAHVTAIRRDGVNPGLLGMRKVISEDGLRNALKNIDEERGISWLDGHLSDSVAPLLDAPWIMDTDTTIKALYGSQEGAEVGYNPKKPGRPSHAYHTYLMSELRLVLGVEVCAGNQHSAKHAQPGLLRVLDSLPQERKPRLLRGDSSFGNDSLMNELEARGQDFLFKLKLTKNVKRFIVKLFAHSGWKDAGQGWEGQEGELALQGWGHKRRVVVLRRAIKGKVIANSQYEQLMLPFINVGRKEGKEITGYEYSVLVTNTGYEIFSIGQLYRDRADAENAFDELKNQWGWCGYTTQDLHRCQLSARAVALIYNWWSLFVRLANPEARREAITSRPWRMASIGCKTEDTGQTCITLTGLHARFADARARLTRVSALLQSWCDKITEQFRAEIVWQRVCDYLKQLLAGGFTKKKRRKTSNLLQLAPANCG